MDGLVSQDGMVAPPALVDGLSLLADRHAVLTANWLSAIGYSAPRTLNVPAAFLLELAAVLQLGEWERQGLTAYLGIEVPTYRDAAMQLAARTKLGVSEFEGPNATSLSNFVGKVWIENFAWDGPAMLNADIVFDDSTGDILADQLAEFLWQHHEDLEKLSTQE
jgi:hypothetical protein